MDNEFPLFPVSASTLSPGVDRLFFYILAVGLFFSAVIFALVIYFAVRYRRRTPNDRATQVAANIPLEIVWTAVPLGLALVMFIWGANLFVQHAVAPPDAVDMYVVAKQWMWKAQHPEGPREINELHVPVGRPFRLVMTSEDTIHSFFVPAFRVKQDVLPGRYTTLWFQATRTGDFHLFCTQYCGTNHAQMGGWVHVMDPLDYERWLAADARGPSMAAAGAAQFQRHECTSCHASGPGERGPSLQGLYGSVVELADGRRVLADDQYIKESIVTPSVKVRRGYSPVMPAYQGQIDEETLFQIVAYIKALGRQQ